MSGIEFPRNDSVSTKYFTMYVCTLAVFIFAKLSWIKLYYRVFRFFIQHFDIGRPLPHHYTYHLITRSINNWLIVGDDFRQRISFISLHSDLIFGQIMSIIVITLIVMMIIIMIIKEWANSSKKEDPTGDEAEESPRNLMSRCLGPFVIHHLITFHHSSNTIQMEQRRSRILLYSVYYSRRGINHPPFCF